MNGRMIILYIILRICYPIILRWGLYGSKHSLELAKICETADMELFKNVIKDCNHVLYDLLLPKKMHGYNLRTRPLQHVLPIKNVYAVKNFLDRMLYVDMY